MSCQQVCNYASAGFAFIAAGLWLWASRAEVKSNYDKPLHPGERYVNFAGGQNPILVRDDGTRIDIVATSSLQNKLNAWAATAAGIAALLQGFAIL
ncbi:hypothetical protein OKW33_000393 [Paraburkholderia atlantica]|uniref:hypothetical protein n=1 Tax=Paraburkholderia atlantica TaxID=2654982 RepID=UPI003D21BDDE